MLKYCIGVDVGGTTVKMGLFTEEGSLSDKWEIVTRKEESGGLILKDIVVSIKEKLKEKSLVMQELLGIGIGIPGPITEDGIVHECVNLGWGRFNIVDEIKKLTGLENIKAGNDANVAALGEMWQGGGKGFDSIIMVTLGTGVGGGVIINGKIVTGSCGAAGEIGHITVKYEEKEACNCGKKGCLEQFASATGIVKETKKKLSETKAPSKLRECSYLSAKVIFDAAKEGDALARESVEQVGWYLGIALSHVAAVVDPQAFVIGGGVSRAGEMLIEVIRKNYEQNVLNSLKDKVFTLAELGNDAGIYGSAKMIL